MRDSILLEDLRDSIRKRLRSINDSDTPFDIAEKLEQILKDSY